MTSKRSPGEWDLAVRQQAALAELGQLGLQSHDLEEVLRAAMQTATASLSVVDAALFELRPEAAVLRGRATIYQGRWLRRATVRRLEVPLGAGSLPGFALTASEPVASADLIADERFRAVAPERGIEVRSAIAAPIGWANQPWGVLAVYDTTVRAWTEDEVRLVGSIATTMGLAVQRARMERELIDSRARLDLSLGAGGLGAWSWHLRSGTVALNEVALEIHGHRSTTFEGTGDEFVAVIHPEDRDRVRQASAEAIEQGRELHHDYRVIRPDNGEVRWVESWGRLLDGESPDAQLVGVCADATERRRSEELRSAILASEHAARVEAETARERLSFLAAASAALGATLDPDVVVEELASLCVPALADVCFVDLVDDDDLLREQACHAATPELLADAHAVRSRRLRTGAEPPPSGRDLAALGSAFAHHDLAPPEPPPGASDDGADQLEPFRRVDARSSILAPLRTRGRTIGIITLVRTGDGAVAYTDDDVAVVEDLAARAALALDNGRLFHSRNRVARSLQAALLPPALPDIPGLVLAARYDVAETDVAIGGDFYDVLPVGPGSWGLVVGDVCGRGPDAAALTGLVRHSLRSAVVGEHEPSRILRQTNAAVLQQIDDSRFCTAALLRVDLAAGAGADPGVRVVASSAGHPRPVVVRADGQVHAVECTGTLLGVVEDPELVDVAVRLGPGDAIVLYTDGVTEARHGTELFGEDRLLEALASRAGRSAEEIAEGLELAVAAFRRSARDDTAILVAQAVDRP